MRRVGALAVVAAACATPPRPRAHGGGGAEPAALTLRVPAATVVATWRQGRLTYGELDRSVDGALGRAYRRAMDDVRGFELLVLRERLGARAGVTIDLPPATAPPGAITRVDGDAIVARWEGGALTYRELDEGRHGALTALYRSQLTELGGQELAAIDHFLQGVLPADRAPAASAPVTDDDARAFQARVLDELGVAPAPELRELLDVDRREREEAAAWRRRRLDAAVTVLLPPPAALRAPFALEGRPHRGPADAPITIVEVTDLACAPCAEAGRALEVVEAALPGQIQTYTLHLPSRFERGATQAAIAAECAHEQGRYAAFRRGLEADARPRTSEVLVDAARGAGLDLARFDTCRGRPEVAARVERDVAQAEVFGARSIPAFFVNGLLGPARAPTREDLQRMLLVDQAAGAIAGGR